MAIQQPLLEEPFQTLRPSNPVFCHQEFLEKLESYRNSPIGKRASLLIQRLAVDSNRQHYKSTQGENHGWRRSRLGGGSGSHFYAWWAPRGAEPLRNAGGFQDSPEQAIFLRDIRHHDDHSIAQAHSLQGHYLPVSVLEMRRGDYGPEPWTQPQVRFASSRQTVRILKGHPGSGKTTALLHATDASNAERVLYLTYSRDLAVLAQEYFDRYCSDKRRFRVLTYDAFLRQLLNVDAPRSNDADLRKRFRGDLTALSRSLGPWTDRVPALFDELHAHMVGEAVPNDAGRFPACSQPRASDEQYRIRRNHFLGTQAVNAVLDVTQRLERNGGRLVDRYFPELGLAWQAACALTGKGAASIVPEFYDFDCIAVDECQDLTPIEALVTVELAAAIRRKKRANTSVFLAGDEAQTVRPTDFEWGWMNDLLYSSLGTPTEFKLSANLRSPRAIASLVNEVWTLYDEVNKRDRPSGSSYAEIDDDATDQVLYCTASQGEELNQLLVELSNREGLAMVTYDDTILAALPESVRPSILTAAEVKGLDFHTVCLLNAGKHLEKITKWRDEYRMQASDIESIRRRLAIDELRVGISRPADRLIWLDINPSGAIVQQTRFFLDRGVGLSVSPTVPSAMLTALAEEQLDIEERIQRCQADARQYLDVRPDVAWSRAMQALTLLGSPMNPAAVRDMTLRKSVMNTLAEICFCLGIRKSRLAPELGRRELFSEAASAASNSGLSSVIRAIGAVVRTDDPAGRLPALGHLAETFVLEREHVEAWLLTEIGPKVSAWLDELEGAAGLVDNIPLLARILPPFYEALRLADAPGRTSRFLDRSVRLLLKQKKYEKALDVLRMLPERKPELEAECLQAIGKYPEAAELFKSVGRYSDALDCYRSAPDFDAAAALIREVPDHPATQSYEWLLKMKAVLSERPANFAKVMTAPEKKFLEQMLEQGLGVARKAPAAKKKAAVKKATVKKKPPKVPF